MITQEKREDGALYVYGRLIYKRMETMNVTDQDMDRAANLLKDKMRHSLWEGTYGDLREPLYELMWLSRRAAESNPAMYSDAARVVELTAKLNDLLDWRKQLAAAGQEKGGIE